MEFKEHFCKFIQFGVVAVSAFSMGAFAEEVRYSLDWQGESGYSASGYFSYDDETSGFTVVGEELTDFYIQAFSPEGVALGEFDYSDIGASGSVFHFGYDRVRNKVLLTGETDPNYEHDLSSSQVFWGFVAGHFSNSNSASPIALASRIGCGTSFPGEGAPEINLYINSNGGCQLPMVNIDTGSAGSGIQAALAPNPKSSEFHSVSISIDAGQQAIPAMGGTLKYDAEIVNKDVIEGNELLRWSVLTLPSGEDYSIHKSTSYNLAAGGIKTFKRPYINVHDWFPAGEYTFSYYIADPDNADKKIVVDSFKFEKLSQ